MESILTSIKKLLGITEEYEHFDADIIIHINSVLAILTQIGLGPSEGFAINDKSTTWDKFIDDKSLNLVKTFVALKVRLLFDPPQSSAVMNSIETQLKELEWRIYVLVDKPISEEEIQNE